MEVKVNGQKSTKHYYWSNHILEGLTWPETTEKRNFLCPPPSRLPTKAEYKALGKIMKSNGEYNPDYFVTNKTDPDHHQSFLGLKLWSSESDGNYSAMYFDDTSGGVFKGNRIYSLTIRCVLVVD